MQGCLRCGAWFSYWFDNLGFITEGNTYRRCAPSSLPLWGNTDVVQAISKGISGAVAGETSSKYTKFLITISSPCNLHYLPFASHFHLPHFTKIRCFIRPLFRSPFSRQISLLFELVTMSDFGMAETDDGLTPKILAIWMLKLLFWGKGML